MNTAQQRWALQLCGIYARGEEAAKAGKPIQDCPYKGRELGVNGQRAQYWRDGWRKQAARTGQTCPDCSASISGEAWHHPTCPRCKQENSIIRSVCRDCGHNAPELQDKIQHFCRVCSHEWLAVGGFAVLK